MKTLILFTLLVFLQSGLLAATKTTDTFIIIGDKTYYCDDIHVGQSKTSIYIDGRQFFKIPTFKVKAYCQKGRLYEYLPVVDKNLNTTGWAFMQYIASSEGKRLYRFCSNCIHYDPVSGKIAPTLPVYRYYTFKGGQFVSVTDDLNEKEELASFGVKAI